MVLGVGWFIGLLDQLFIKILHLPKRAGGRLIYPASQPRETASSFRPSLGRFLGTYST